MYVQNVNVYIVKYKAEYAIIFECKDTIHTCLYIRIYKVTELLMHINVHLSKYIPTYTFHMDIQIHTVMQEQLSAYPDT